MQSLEGNDYMPVYEEKIKDPKTGTLKSKLVGPEKRKQYFIRTYVKDEFGNKKQVTKHNKDWIGLEGKNKAQQEENYLKSGKLRVQKKISLKKLAEEYLEYKKPMVKLSTYLKYKDDIENYILKYFKHKSASEINPNDILRWQKEINKLNLSTRTKQSLYTSFSSLIKYGCISYSIEKNAVTMVDNFKSPKGQNKREVNILTQSEFEAFIKFEKNTVYKNFFTILFYTGMRRGELLALTVDDIDFEKNTININKTYNPRYKKYGITETTPKTSKSNREIQMLLIVREIMKKMVATETKKIFTDITLTTLKRKCDQNLKKAKIDKNIRIHDFRHSFASLCVEKNVPIGVISEYIGHENISITLDTYSHLYPNSQEKLLEKLS